MEDQNTEQEELKDVRLSVAARNVSSACSNRNAKRATVVTDIRQRKNCAGAMRTVCNKLLSSNIHRTPKKAGQNAAKDAECSNIHHFLPQCNCSSWSGLIYPERLNLSTPSNYLCSRIRRILRTNFVLKG